VGTGDAEMVRIACVGDCAVLGAGLEREAGRSFLKKRTKKLLLFGSAATLHG
jgi:hypothetical protein